MIIIQKHQEVCANSKANDKANDNITNSENKITGNTPNADNKKDIEIAVPLKYLSSF